MKLARGAQVIIIGQAMPDPKDQRKWWPIQPPEGEVRYLAKDAVRVTPAVEVVAGAAPVGQPGVPAVAAVPADANTLRGQAEQAERAGNAPQAVQLYEQLGRLVSNTDGELSRYAYNRAQFLRDNNRGSVPAGYQPGVPAVAQTGGDARLVPTPASSQGQAAGYGPRPAPQPALQVSGPGRMRRAGFFVDGKQAYVLENSQGRVQLYLTAQQGINLEQFVNRVVDLSGPIEYRGDLRTHYMRVHEVRVVQ
jgi:hypothetical protein